MLLPLLLISYRQQVDDLTQGVCTERFTTDDLRIELTCLQKRFNATMQRSGALSLLPSSDPSLQTSDRELNERRFS